jgi:deoxyribonuclease V
MELFPGVFSEERAKRIQQYIADRVVKQPNFTHITTITGADVSYRGNMACAALVTLGLPHLEVIEQVSAISEVHCPYIPGFLSFRKGPPLINVYKLLKHTPEMMMFDGHGIAHPRGAGLAAHMGMYCGIPAIGCAKNNLCGTCEEPSPRKGSYSHIIDNDNCIGAALRTQDDVQPVFISIGHFIDLEKAIEIVLASCTTFRIPEPIRQSHMLCGKWL